MNLFLGSTTVPKTAFKKIQDITNSKSPRIGVLDIAAKPYIEELDEDPSWLVDQLNGLENVGFKLIRFSVMESNWFESLKSKIEELDGIYISGGNVWVLNEAIQQEKIQEFLFKILYDNSKVVVGSSAGTIIFANDISQYKIIDNPKKKQNNSFQKV